MVKENKKHFLKKGKYICNPKAKVLKERVAKTKAKVTCAYCSKALSAK